MVHLRNNMLGISIEYDLVLFSDVTLLMVLLITSPSIYWNGPVVYGHHNGYELNPYSIFCSISQI